MKLYRLLIALAMLSFVLNGKQAQAQAQAATLDELFDLDITESLELESSYSFSKSYDKFNTMCLPQKNGNKLVLGVTGAKDRSSCLKQYKKLQAQADAILSGEEDGFSSSGGSQTIINEAKYSKSCQVCLANLAKIGENTTGALPAQCQEICKTENRTEMVEAGINGLGNLAGLWSYTSIAKQNIRSQETRDLAAEKTAMVNGGVARTSSFYKTVGLGLSYGQGPETAYALDRNNLYTIMSNMGNLNNGGYNMGQQQYGYSPYAGAYNPFSSVQGINNWSNQFSGNSWMNQPYANTGNGYYNNAGRTGRGITRIGGSQI